MRTDRASVRGASTAFGNSGTGNPRDRSSRRHDPIGRKREGDRGNPRDPSGTRPKPSRHSGWRSEPGQLSKIFVVEESPPECECRVRQERVVAREKHERMEQGPRRHRSAPILSAEQQERRAQAFDGESRRRAGGVHRHRQMLHPPTDPRGEWAVLVIRIHRTELPPARITTRELCDPRLEPESETQEPNEPHHDPRRGRAFSEARPESPRCKIHAQERALDQEPFRLEAREISLHVDERDIEDRAHREGWTRPEIQHDTQSGQRSHPAARAQRAIANVDPEQRWDARQRVEPTGNAQPPDEVSGGQDPLGTDQPSNLRRERKEVRRESDAEDAEKQPARVELRWLARGEERIIGAKRQAQTRDQIRNELHRAFG